VRVAPAMIDFIRAPAITQRLVDVDVKWGNGDIVTDHNALYAQFHELLGGWWPEGATWYSGFPVHIRTTEARAGIDATSLFTQTSVPRAPALARSGSARARFTAPARVRQGPFPPRPRGSARALFTAPARVRRVPFHPTCAGPPG